MTTTGVPLSWPGEFLKVLPYNRAHWLCGGERDETKDVGHTGSWRNGFGNCGEW
jgi:hypothetical protein